MGGEVSRHGFGRRRDATAPSLEMRQVAQARPASVRGDAFTNEQCNFINQAASAIECGSVTLASPFCGS